MAAADERRAEFQRRRLTVGLTEQAGAMAAVGGGPGELEETLKRLQPTGRPGRVADFILDRDGTKIPGATLLQSQTDNDANRRRSFLEKDRCATGDEGTMNIDDTTRTFNSLNIGMACKKGQKPESPNQDSFSVVLGPITSPFKVYAVFDGHGPAGHDVSSYAADALMKLFLSDSEREDQPERALERAFGTVQRLLEYMTTKRQLDSSVSGTTCTVAYFPPDGNSIVIAHVGDSRSVLHRQVDGAPRTVDLTVDHKPNNPEERARIEKAGGKVVFDGYYNHRVYSRDGRGGLNMSRALGDCIAHQAGVTEVPEIARRALTITTEAIPTKDQFLLLCTDGVWEFIESDAACNMVRKHPKDQCQAAVEELAKESYDKWMEDSDGEVSDDITALLIWLS